MFFKSSPDKTETERVEEIDFKTLIPSESICRANLVPVRVFDDKDELIHEFKTISGAIVFINNVSKIKLKKTFSRGYINKVISGKRGNKHNILEELGLSVKRSHECIGCGLWVLGEGLKCDDCSADE